MRIRATICLAVLLACSATPNWQSASTSTQTVKSDLIRDLLALPAPSSAAGTPAHPAPQFDESSDTTSDDEPPEDAPLEVLSRYWAEESVTDGTKLSENLRQRLLAACEAQPELLGSLIRILPDTPDSYDRIKAIYDRNADKFNDSWRENVVKHLKTHSKYFRDQLVAEARAAKDADEGGYVNHSDELETLTRIDWIRAEPVLRAHAAGTAPRTALLAKTLLFRHFVATHDSDSASALQKQLMAVVEDITALGYSRDTAFDALWRTEWPGRDDWYQSLFKDSTLRQLRDGMYWLAPITYPVARNPDHWIPIIARLVKSPDRAVHDNAVECLISFQLTRARRDALLPLLPWLYDRTWSSARDRLRLIQSVDRLDMRESIPGLISVLAENNEAERSYAAEALGVFKDPRAIPALGKAVTRENNWIYRRKIIDALIACGGLSTDEAASSVEAFADFAKSPEGAKVFEEYQSEVLRNTQIPVSVSIGYCVVRSATHDDTLIDQLLTRVNETKATHPELSKKLQAIIADWPSRSSDLAIVTRIQNGTADAAVIAAALPRRASFQKTVSVELNSTESRNGFAAGFAAVLIADRRRESEILQGGDIEAQTALLAGARLIREPLSLNDVAAVFKSRVGQLSDAAEAYLQSEDSPTARKLFTERHPGQAIILGAREQFDPGHTRFRQFDSLEDQLRDEIKESHGPQEVFALLTSGYYVSSGQIIIRIKNSAAELMYVDNRASYLVRNLTPAELERLREFVKVNQADDLGPLNGAESDSAQYEYVHVTRDGGRRVFMDHVGALASNKSTYNQLWYFFRELKHAAPMHLHYRTSDKLPGFRVLLADDRFDVYNVWAQGNDLRVQVGISDRQDVRKTTFDDDTVIHIRALPSSSGPREWMAINGSSMTAATAPAAFPPNEPVDLVPKRMYVEPGYQPAPWSLSVNGVAYRVGDWNNHSGFWKLAPDKEPELLIEGRVAMPVLTPDGNWAILAQTDRGWDIPNYLIRVNLRTGNSTRLDVPIADTLDPVAYVPEKNAVLAFRDRDKPTKSDSTPTGPEHPEFWLIDPSTGKSEIVHGEFGPLQEIDTRPLQKAAEPGIYWAAICDESTRTTTIGKYDASHFTFAKVVAVPELEFGSKQMWVDEKEGRAYVAYDGHLLQIPLSATDVPR
jgi:hypothetical protein